MPDNTWYIYLLRTAHGSLYTGITTDVYRRLNQHQAGKGAKSLRGKGELLLVFHYAAGDRSTALKLEYRVKQLSKIQKEKLVMNSPSSIQELLTSNKKKSRTINNQTVESR